MFNDIERTAIQSLPTTSFEFYKYKTVKVYNNSHISYQKYHYAVPYQYIGQSLKLKIYVKKIQVWHQECMLSEHEI